MCKTGLRYLRFACVLTGLATAAAVAFSGCGRGDSAFESNYAKSTPFPQIRVIPTDAFDVLQLDGMHCDFGSCFQHADGASCGRDISARYHGFDIPDEAWPGFALQSYIDSQWESKIYFEQSKRGSPYHDTPGTMAARELNIRVKRIYRPDVPFAVKNPNYFADEAVFNSEAGWPLPSIRQYYLDQSYGYLSLSFVQDFSPVEVDFNDGAGIGLQWIIREHPELGLDKYVIDEKYRIIDVVYAPIIEIKYPSWGTAGRTSLQGYTANYDGFDAIVGVIKVSYADWIVQENPEKPAELFAQNYNRIVVLHEIGHILNWPDTNPTGSPMDSVLRSCDLMAGGAFPLGLHKAVAGWTCLLNTKYDTNARAIKPQDVGSNPRELVFLEYNPASWPEFWYMENQAGGGWILDPISGLPGYGFGKGHTGLIVARVNLSSGQSVPGGDRVESGIPLVEIPSLTAPQSISQFPALISKTYPFIGSEFSPTTTPPANWWDGSSCGFSVSGIKYLSNRHYRPYFFKPEEDYIGFGDIICDVDVGNPLYGDFNGDGIVNEGDENMLRANIGRRVGVDPLAVPLDVNGDGEIGLARDRDRDGFIATSERIYDDGWTLVHSTGDWLDLN
ncbi:MAG: hypothetical protein HRF49_11265, partial [bacterium]